MAVSASDAVSLVEALTALGPLIGAGGVASIVTAVLGYRAAMREGRKPALDPGTQMGLATLFTDRVAIEQAAAAVKALVVVLEKVAHAVDGLDGQRFETLIDELRHLRRAIEDSCRDGRRR